MDFIFMYLLCVALAYYNIHTYSATAIRSANNFDIDGFINSQLISDKFDELADKIADKTIRKLKSIEWNSVDTLRNNNQMNGHNKKLTEYQIKEQAMESEETKKLLNTIQKQLHSDKFNKIDTRTFMKRKPFHSSDTLTLNYKYLTKGHKEMEVKKTEQSDTRDIQEVLEENSLKHKKILSKTRNHNFNNDKGRDESIESDKNINSYSKRITDISSEEVNINTKQQNQDSEEINHKKVTDIQEIKINDYHNYKENDNDQSHQALDKKHENLEETAQLIRSQNPNILQRENKEDDLLMDSITTELYKGSEEKLKNEKHKVVQNTLLRSSTETLDDSYENKDLSEKDITTKTNTEEVSKEKNINTVKKRIVREERGKLFTFDSSPDYAEYHETVAKLQKQEKK